MVFESKIEARQKAPPFNDKLFSITCPQFYFPKQPLSNLSGVSGIGSAPGPDFHACNLLTVFPINWRHGGLDFPTYG